MVKSALLSVAIFGLSLPVFAGNSQVFQGSYHGFSLGLAREGVPLSESEVSFTFDSSGLTMTEAELSSSKQIWKVHYGPQWLSTTAPAAESYADASGRECIALLQHPDHKSALFVFCLPKQAPKPRPGLILLGEGMPAVLSLFFKDVKGQPQTRLLEAEYKNARKEKGGPDVSYAELQARRDATWARPTNSVAALSTLKGTDIAAKVALFKGMEGDTWTQSEDEIALRMELVKIGLQDSALQVQYEAINVLNFSGRVRPAIPVVVEFLKNAAKQEPVILKKAVESATGLIYEAYQLTKHRRLLKAKFGSAVPEKIYEKTKGLIEGEDIESLREVLREVPPSRQWNDQDHALLLQALWPIAKSTTLDRSIVQRAQNAIRDYQ